MRLPCLFRVGDPEYYEQVTINCRDKTYNGVSGVNEHMWRYHSWDTRCDACGKTFRQATHETIEAIKEYHKLTDCPPKDPSRKREAAKPLTGMSKEQHDEWRDWAKTLPKRSPGGSVAVEHWKHMYRIFYKDQEAPDPVAISKEMLRRGKNSKPSGTQPPPSSSSNQSLPSSSQPPPPSNKPRGKRQASSPPVGERSGPRQRPSSPKQHATGPQTGDFDFHMELDDATWPQSQTQPQAQLHHCNLAAALNSLPLHGWYKNPLSADPDPAHHYLRVPDTATGGGRGESWAPDSFCRSDGSTTTDQLFRPATPSNVRPDVGLAAADGMFPAGLDDQGGAFGGLYDLPGLEDGGAYPWTIEAIDEADK